MDYYYDDAMDYYDDEDDDDGYDNIMDWFNNLSPGEKQYYYDEAEMEGKPLASSPKAGSKDIIMSMVQNNFPVHTHVKNHEVHHGAKSDEKPQLSPELGAKIAALKNNNPEGLEKFQEKMAKIHAETAAKQSKATPAKKGNKL